MQHGLMEEKSRLGKWPQGPQLIPRDDPGWGARIGGTEWGDSGHGSPWGHRRGHTACVEASPPGWHLQRTQTDELQSWPLGRGTCLGGCGNFLWDTISTFMK